jgi:hypothetical protein
VCLISDDAEYLLSKGVEDETRISCRIHARKVTLVPRRATRSRAWRSSTTAAS